MDTFWSGKRVLVTGGGGFVGRAVVATLRQQGARESDLVIPRSRECDLRELDQCRRAAQGCEIVIHLAAPTGNINFSRTHPASQFRDCTLINLNVFEAARQARVQKIITVGNLLAYPVEAVPPYREEHVQIGRAHV